MGTNADEPAEDFKILIIGGGIAGLASVRFCPTQREDLG